MPYHIQWEDNGIVWTFFGVVTGEETTQANLEIYGDPRFGDLLYQIVDITNVEQFDLTSDDLDESAALDEASSLSNLRIVVAVVAAADEAVEIALLYQAAMNQASWTVEIFPTMEDAKEWIRSTC